MNASSQPRRLPVGGLVNRAIPLSFRFDNKDYSGLEGDTIASALLACGVTLVGRSFKYHRPRGIVSAGSEEPNALVELRNGARREPNTRATMAQLYEGLEARSQNRWPSLGLDVGGINSLLAPLLVAGFYYKTFMWPAKFWEKLYEPMIRRAAGLGRAARQADPDHYETVTAHCDLLVIGAGPAGLAAALAAGRSGARVILCDEDFLLGGRLNSDRHEIDGMDGARWARATTAELKSLSNVQLLPRTTVFGCYDSGTFGALERVADHRLAPREFEPRQRYWKLIARRSVLAAGALERPIVFGGNDRPGIMLASALRTYVGRFGVQPGKQIALFTSGDDGWKTAHDLEQAGVPLAVVIDARPTVNTALTGPVGKAGTRIILGGQVVATRGWLGLSHIVVKESGGHGTIIQADILAMAGGWNPALALTTHLGSRPIWSDTLAAFTPGPVPNGMRVAGAAGGTFSIGAILREGSRAGQQAAEELGFNPSPTHDFRSEDEPSAGASLWHVAGSRGKAFVDFQNDVTAADVAIAAQEGFRSAELLKRYTTLGMATDQGKTSNINGHAILAEFVGRTIPEIGTTVSRPPYTPVAIGALAGIHRGTHYRPTRLTAAHDWAIAQGATFIEAGQWLRAQWFARPGENDWLQSVSREVKTVRSHVGVCDVSTLGKIDVQGRDAAVFLDRVYANTFSTLPVGKVRYGLMLREDGFILDDGTAARFGDNHFVISTTTANAGLVMQHLEHARQVTWPEFDIHLSSVTDHWAQFSIAGPDARRSIQNLLGDALDISATAFPFMACAQFFWRGIPARLFRISFSGELAYEIAVPSRYGDATIRAIMEIGQEYGIAPYGTEALSVMRIEKGHVAGGELNGTTTADDLGLGRMMAKKKDFIGRVLAGRPALVDSCRPTLVGIRPLDRSAQISAGAHFLERGASANLENDQGYLTSVAFSPTVESWIGLGLIIGGVSRVGEIIRAYDPVRGRDTEVVISAPVFVDPEGSRVHA